MNFHENLIAEMKKRPMLWNRYDDNYNNRPLTDREWDNVSKTLKKTKEFVKQKWRTLRDQFLRELKKVKVPVGVTPTKPMIHYYRGQWHYFEQMLFLKNAVTSRRTRSPSITDILPENTGNISEGEIRDCEVKVEAEDWESGSESLNFNDCLEARSLRNVEKIVFPEIEMGEIENSREEDASITVNADRKRKLSDFECLQAKTVKLNEDAEIDDDLHFVKSLVPFLKKLSPVRKLLVRNEIQNILIRETLCEDCRCPQDNSCHRNNV